MLAPRQLAEHTESHPRLPQGPQERFSGTGVMGLPFRSGHVLGLRRFAASSLGRGYTSVWHRTPSGAWTFYQDAPAAQGCARYFGPGLRRSLERPISLRWTAADRLSVQVDEGREVQWELTLAAPAAVRAMNALAGLMPQALWRSEAVLRAMAVMARRLLGTGRLALTGRAPSGQHFLANPLVVWTVASSHARAEREELGPPGPLPEQAHLGDSWIPQRGLFVVGQAFFEPMRRRRELHAEA